MVLSTSSPPGLSISSPVRERLPAEPFHRNLSRVRAGFIFRSPSSRTFTSGGKAGDAAEYDCVNKYRERADFAADSSDPGNSPAREIWLLPQSVWGDYPPESVELDVKSGKGPRQGKFVSEELVTGKPNGGWLLPCAKHITSLRVLFTRPNEHSSGCCRKLRVLETLRR